MAVHFQCILELREGGETFLWWNLVWLSDTDAWDDTQGDVYIMAGSGTLLMLNVICIFSCDCSDDEDSSKGR